MKIYWSINSVPEIRDLDFAIKDKIARTCMLRALRRWQVWVGVLLVFLLHLVLRKVGTDLFGSSKPVLDMLWWVGNIILPVYIFRVIIFNYSLPCIREEVKSKTKSQL